MEYKVVSLTQDNYEDFIKEEAESEKLSDYDTVVMVEKDQAESMGNEILAAASGDAEDLLVGIILKGGEKREVEV